MYPKYPARSVGEEVIVYIPHGASLKHVTELLSNRDVIENAFLWFWYARMRGAEKKLRSGNTVLNQAMSPAEVLRHVARGFGPAYVKVTIPEGFNLFDIAKRLEQRGVCSEGDFIKSAKNQSFLHSQGIRSASAEGYLFPDTYLLGVDEQPESIIRRLVENWRKRVFTVFTRNAQGLVWLKRKLEWNESQVLILASIVEKEARFKDEQSIIAGVFLNRLTSPTFNPKRLQADPTVAYGCIVSALRPESCTNIALGVTRAMISDVSNSYNTYRIEGLPPTPICNPGLSAIEAVLSPKSHDYYYFVADGRGRHMFSRTLAQHSRNVNVNR